MCVKETPAEEALCEETIEQEIGLLYFCKLVR